MSGMDALQILVILGYVIVPFKHNHVLCFVVKVKAVRCVHQYASFTFAGKQVICSI